jgi:SOS-response transcriptional repressor LexA
MLSSIRAQSVYSDWMVDSFGSWLRIQIERLYPSQAAFARQIGVIPQAVNNWVLDKNKPELESITAIAQALGTDPYTVASRAEIELPGSRPAVRSVDDILRELEANQPVPVPVVQNVTASMGPGIPVDEYLYLPARYRQNRKTILAVRAKGACMEPQISEGDYVIFDKNARWGVGNIVVAVIEGEVFVKRLALVGGKQVLRGDADGSIVSLEGLTKDDGVVGRVIQITRPLDDEVA